MRTWLSDRGGIFSEHIQSRVREQEHQRREEVSAPSTVLSFRDSYAQTQNSTPPNKIPPPLINEAIIFKGRQGGRAKLDL